MIAPARNDPCHCGSRRRYKSCCGALIAGPFVPAVELEQLNGLLQAARYAELESVTREMLGRKPPPHGPQSAALWQLLALARTRQGKDAVQALGMAVRSAPENAVAQLNLGNALARLGRHEEAEVTFGRALALDPEFAEAHNNLGELHLDQQRPEEALANFREAARIRPDYATAHENLARVLVRLQRFDEALLSGYRTVAISPQSAAVHDILGSALAGLFRSEEAIASFTRALEINPSFAAAHANMGQALRAMGRLDEAVAAYRRALLIAPRLVQARTELATALRLQHRTLEAEQSCRQALDADPDCTAAVLVLAEVKADAGRFAESEQLLRRAISLDPDSSEAWAGLARVRRMTPADRPWLETAQRLIAQGLAPKQELLLRYATGKYLDDVGDFEHAFRNYRHANELAKRCGPPHDRGALANAIDLIIRAQNAQWINRRREALPQSSRPVFIVGMMRSGTTLAEQILASHPAVSGTGELTFWSRITAAVSAVCGADGAALRIDDATLADYANRYLRSLNELTPVALRVVDKLPTNFLSLGTIHAALPRSRIIHLVRHPIDTCLSIYFQHFDAANTYTHDLGDLAHYYGQYRRLMQHWRTVLPAGSILQVPYEGLVADLPHWTRRMLEFIGLPWDSRCLDFHLTQRPVVTASKWQVRQQLFASSVGRWRRYQRFIAELAPLTEPVSQELIEALSSPP
jgi:tetratricopeptide (TPR) repeat protein